MTEGQSFTQQAAARNIFVPGGPPRMAHQKRGLTKMIRTHGVCALLFDPGTGKTATTLDYLSLLALKSPTGEARVLVVAPLAAVDTWVIQAETYVSPQVHYWAEALGGSLVQRAEALAARGGHPFRPKRGEPVRAVKPRDGAPRARHWDKSIAWGARASSDRPRPITATEGPDGLGTDKPRLVIISVNFDTFSSRQANGGGTMADLMLDAVKRFEPDVVVVDESHKIKGAMSNVSRLLGRIGAVVPRRLALTGTVMPAGPLDVFGQWRFLDPYAFGDLDPKDGTRKRATFDSFKDRYAVMGGYLGREVTGYKNLDDMQEVMARNASVVRKEDALDLPKTRDVVVDVLLSPAEKKAYNEMKKGLAVALNSGSLATAPNKLAQMMRLRQITSGHLPDDTGAVQTIGESKASTIASIVHDNLLGEDRVVVFALFTAEIDLLERKLSRPGTVIYRIDGSTPGPERIAMRQRFGDRGAHPERIVLIAQIKTLSLAVNELVTASNAVFGSLSQQRDDLIQGRDRLNRIGQTKPVTFWYAIAPKTVDAVILKTHDERTSLEANVLAHILDTEAI
jgi:SNF2 family DNA or RNA helicase